MYMVRPVLWTRAAVARAVLSAVVPHLAAIEAGAVSVSQVGWAIAGELKKTTSLPYYPAIQLLVLEPSRPQLRRAILLALSSCSYCYKVPDSFAYAYAARSSGERMIVVLYLSTAHY